MLSTQKSFKTVFKMSQQSANKHQSSLSGPNSISGAKMMSGISAAQLHLQNSSCHSAHKFKQPIQPQLVHAAFPLQVYLVGDAAAAPATSGSGAVAGMVGGAEAAAERVDEGRIEDNSAVDEELKIKLQNFVSDIRGQYNS